VKMFDF